MPGVNDGAGSDLLHGCNLLVLGLSLAPHTPGLGGCCGNGGVAGGKAHIHMCPPTPGEEHDTVGPSQGHTLMHRQAATFPAGKGGFSGGAWA